MKPIAAAFLVGIWRTAAPAAEPETAEYLSDSLSERIISATQGWGELGVNSAAHLPNQPHLGLRIKDREYAQGLGTHANSEIVLDLRGQFKTFETEVGLQWSDGTSPGSAIFQILVDGKKVFDSGAMRENDPPQPVTVSVLGAGELRLVANDAGDGITADSADWADARLIREPAAAKRSRSPTQLPHRRPSRSNCSTGRENPPGKARGNPPRLR
jgi:hypothetical protein